MPVELRYAVTGAILTKKREGAMWTLTFTPEPASPDAPFDPEVGKEIVITLSPADVDNMFFDMTYTKAEIEALRGAG